MKRRQRMARWDWLDVFVHLAALGYLGFYAFGWVMGVFSPADVPVLTAIAAVCVIGSIALAVHERRSRARARGPAALAPRGRG